MTRVLLHIVLYILTSQYALHLLNFESIEEMIAKIILTFYFSTRISDKKSSDVLLYGSKLKHDMHNYLRIISISSHELMKVTLRPKPFSINSSENLSLVIHI